MNKLTTSQIGDAGEFYALGRFIFSGRAAAKMPENWPGYDLAVDLEGKLKKISVKTRTTEKDSFTTEHCRFSVNDSFDFLVCIFKSKNKIRSWIIPADVAAKEGQITNGNNEEYRRLSFKQLSSMKNYENNWSLKKNYESI